MKTRQCMCYHSKMMITLQQIKLWIPNKYHLFPYNKSNHLIPNVSSLDNVQLNQKHKSYFFAKKGLKSHAKGHFPLMGLLIRYRAHFAVLETVEAICVAISLRSNHKMTGLVLYHYNLRTCCFIYHVIQYTN